MFTRGYDGSVRLRREQTDPQATGRSPAGARRSPEDQEEPPAESSSDSTLLAGNGLRWLNLSL